MFVKTSSLFKLLIKFFDFFIILIEGLSLHYQPRPLGSTFHKVGNQTVV